MRLAAGHPGLVSAVVSVDGELLAGAGAPRPTAPVRIYLVHGTADLMQPWSGRGPRGVAMPAYESEPATAAEWVAADHAGPGSTTSLPTVAGRCRS